MNRNIRHCMCKHPCIDCKSLDYCNCFNNFSIRMRRQNMNYCKYIFQFGNYKLHCYCNQEGNFYFGKLVLRNHLNINITLYLGRKLLVSCSSMGIIFIKQNSLFLTNWHCMYRLQCLSYKHRFLSNCSNII